MQIEDIEKLLTRNVLKCILFYFILLFDVLRSQIHLSTIVIYL